MPEGEPKYIIPHCEDNLTAQEAELLHQAENGGLPCPCCGQPLAGVKVMIEGIYEGVLLSCWDVSGCGFVES